MPEGNPLVAQSKQDGSGPFVAGNSDYGWLAGTNLTESGMDALNGIASGDWVSGGLGVLSLAAEVASAAVDPFGYLMSSVASFLMEHVKPLKDMLDSIAGNPPVIQSYADTWGNVSKALGERKTDFDNAVKNGTTGWTGTGADAYRKFAAEHSDALSAAASVASGISTAVMIMGQVVAFVRQMVRQLIADLVGKLISWVMEEVFSLGFGTPVVVAQATAAIAKWGKKIGELLKKLTDTIRKISPLLSKLVDIFEKIAKVFGKVLGKVTGLDGIKLKDTGFVHHLPKEKGGVHARAHTEGGGSGESGHHGEGDSSPGEGSHGSDGESSHSADGETGDSPRSGESEGRTPSESGDSPSSDPMNTDGRSGGDSGSRRTSGRDDGASTGNGTPGEDGSPSSFRGDDSAPAHSGGGDSSPSPTRSGGGGDSGGSPTGHANSGGDDLGSTPSHTGDGGGSPSHRGDSSPAPAPARAGNDGGGTPSHTGDSAPAPARSATPSHADGGSPAPTHSESSSSPGARSDAPSSHAGTETPSSAAPPRADGTTSASGTAPSPARAGEPGAPPPRAGDSAAPAGIPPQGGAPMAGGMPPGGAPGGAGGLAGTPGGRAGAGPWTGTPGSPGAQTPHTPHVPEPSARPGRAGGDPRPRTPGGEPAPAARGFGPQGTTETHAPGTRPGGNGPGGRPGGPEHAGPGGTHGTGESTPGHGTHENAPRDHDGSPSHEPDGGPHHEPEQLTPDEVNARHSESTPSGSSYHAGDAEMGDLPHRVRPDPDGRYTVDVHVTPDGHARIGDRLYTPEQFADILRRNPDYDGRPIRLIGCDAASNDFAHRLSRELDTEVMAPTKPAWTDSHGRVFSSDYEIGPDGRMRPRIPPDGEWQTHHPDGTTHRASDDGFTPDTHESQKHDLDADDAKDRGKRYIDDDPVAIEHPEREPKASMKEKLNDEEYRRKYYDGPDKNGEYSRKNADQTDHGDERLPKIKEDKTKPAGEQFEPKSDDFTPAEYRKDIDEVEHRATDRQKQEAQQQIDDRAAANERARNAEADYQEAKEKGTVSDEIEKERSEAHRMRTEHGEELGEHAGRDAVQDRYPEKDYEVKELPDPELHGDNTRVGEKPGSGRFDQIYQVTDRSTGETRYVVVEAKGPNAGLGTRKGLDGANYEQGHPHYVDSIIDNMRKNGTPAEKRLADDLEVAKDLGDLDYSVAKARVRDENMLDEHGEPIPDPDNPGKFKKRPVYGGYNLKHFDLSIDS